MLIVALLINVCVAVIFLQSSCTRHKCPTVARLIILSVCHVFFLIACSIRLIQTHCIAMFHNTGFSPQFQIYLYFNCQIKAGNCKLRKARDMSQIRNVTPNRHSFITSLQQYALNLIHVISLNKFKMLLPPFCIFTDYAR